MKLDVVITVGLIITAAITLWSVFTVNHFYVG